MIVALSVVGGFKASIREKLYAFEGHIHIHQYGLNTFQTASMPPIQMDSVLEKKITGVPGVTHIAPFIKRAGILQFDGKMEGLMFKGVPENFHFSQSISFSGNKIDYSDTAYSKDILLSRATADRLELKVGDMAQIYFLEEGSTFPRIRKVRLAGIFHTAMEEVDRANALCDIRLLRNINSWEEGDISAYQLSLADDKQSEKIADKILEEYLVSPLYSFTMEETYAHVFAWLKMMDVNASIILTIMAIVAIINLAVALVILIVEQARMVGVLKAQGMTIGQMRSVFLYYAGLIAGIGVFAGNVLALGLAWLQHETGFLKLSETSYYMTTVPFRVIWWHVLVTDVATLLLCIACMFLPTMYIRRIQPARVLQFK